MKMFIYHLLGDEEKALGTYQHADYVLNNKHTQVEVFAGKEYEYNIGEKADYKMIAQSIADGKNVGWFQGKSESGNRALKQ